MERALNSTGLDQGVGHFCQDNCWLRCDLAAWQEGVILHGELTHVAKPVDGLPEGDRLGLDQRDAPGPEIAFRGKGPDSAQDDLETGLLAERLDDFFKGCVLEVEADQ